MPGSDGPFGESQGATQGSSEPQAGALGPLLPDESLGDSSPMFWGAAENFSPTNPDGSSSSQLSDDFDSGSGDDYYNFQSDYELSSGDYNSQEQGTQGEDREESFLFEKT
ncbi:hypothetical protein ETB97_011063 [Aspergillus alliaceus]|uniref:Uncharacterized protein n=1 Tax=Petromyces alliaceus TaxID=209559 RepID=A0A8H5ZSF8_PETAA|nr:hypothetical protein ETB97_011063 [Aspergillus burnettii]